MDTQTQAQIYLSDQRGCSQVDYFRSFHNFNFGPYFDESRKPFGALQLLNDNTLKAGRAIQMQVTENTEVVVLPIVGGLEYKSEVGNGFLEPGQVQIFSLASGMTYGISNPYETEQVNFIEIWLTNQQAHFAPKIQQVNFDINQKQQLLPLFDVDGRKGDDPSFRGFIGRYDGRQEDVYDLAKPTGHQSAKGVFVFVLSGVFEVQNRLLHERDGLAMANVQHDLIDFEALSNDALLLLLEIPV